MEIYKDSLHNLIESESYGTVKELPCGICYKTGSLLENVLATTLKNNGIILGETVAPHVKGMIYGMSDVPNIIVTYYSHGLDVLKVALTDIVCKTKTADFDTMFLLIRNLPLIESLLEDSTAEDATEILADIEEICIGFAQHGFLQFCNTFQIMDLLESEDIQPYVNNIAFKIQNFFELKFSEIYDVEEFTKEIVASKHYKYFAKEILLSSKDVKEPFLTGNIEDDLLTIFDVKFVTGDLSYPLASTMLYKTYRDIIKDLERSVNVDGLCIADPETLYVHVLAIAYKDLVTGKNEQDLLITLVKSCILKNLLSSRKYLGSQLIEKSLVW